MINGQLLLLADFITKFNQDVNGGKSKLNVS